MSIKIPLFRVFILLSICGVLLIYILSMKIHQVFWYDGYDGYDKENLERFEKIKVIERSIGSPINRLQCRMPFLPIDNHEIMKFYKSVPKIYCNYTDDWITCRESTCFLKPEVVRKYDEITCSYTDIIRKNDFHARYGKTVVTKGSYVLIESDFAKVICRTDSGLSWFGLVFGIRDKRYAITHSTTPQPIPQPQIINPQVNIYSSLAPDMPHINVLMYGFDSLSRNAFMRKLPKTYKYLVDKLNAIVLTGYNIVGDGTPQALIPILTGYNELELPDTRQNALNSVSLDNVYPLIWKDYQRHGYVTSFNEDTPETGIFTYRLKGFKSQPVDHYLRTFYMESKLLTSSAIHCIGHQPDHVVMLEYTKNLMIKYKNIPSFVFSFHGGLSHDDINLIGAADDDVLQWLQYLHKKKILDNTVLIFMSDHGSRFSELRATLQGKQEERLPFFSFVFPKKFRDRFPSQYENFLRNRERLTTPFDIHATLKQLLDLQIQKKESKDFTEERHNVLTVKTVTSSDNALPKLSFLARNRAISLFDRIPMNRSCADAYIEIHWCACLNWHTIELSDPIHRENILKAASSIIDSINNATLAYRQYCYELQLGQVNWVSLLKPQRELLQFKRSNDADGFIADMNDNTIVDHELYQLQIVITPGDSLFEATVRHDLQNLAMSTQLSEISRINKYGTQANCISERNPDLRKYCYCKT